MSGLLCPHCSKFIPIFSTGGGRKTSSAMKVRFLGELPFDPEVVEAGDRGTPLLEERGDTLFVKALDQFVDKVLALCNHT